MGLIQLFTSLWPFFKEIFIGDKIKDNNSSKEGRPKKRHPILAAHWFLDKMQMSKRFLSIIMIALILSIFVNYKLFVKLTVTTVLPNPNRFDENDSPVWQPAKEKNPNPTIPSKGEATHDRETLIRGLSHLYGGKT